MAQVTIEIIKGECEGQATFDPATQPVTSLDNLFWANNDETSAHWPAPSADAKTAWMPAAIPIKLAGQPAPTSRGMAFDAGTYSIQYVCALHPEETGTINVTS